MLKTDIRALVGVPSWMLVLLKKITLDTGKPIRELWPNIEVFFMVELAFVHLKSNLKNHNVR